ncbi:MAG: MATE family efflux transporter, partial [Fibrobacter sp.]|nr:MATE family efflux transporter [Fibrobacter sp.]
RGAAVATSIARAVEVIICVVIASRLKEIKLRVEILFRKSGVLLKDFFHFSLPALGNEFIWGAAFATYSVILGHLGEDIVAANSVVNVARNLGSVVVFGIGYGGQILLGKEMGSGDLGLAERDASRLWRSAFLAGVAGGILMIILKPVLPLLADLNETSLKYLNYMVYMNAYSILGAAINTVFICGIFRAGGDSKFGFITDTIAMWAVSVPLGLLSWLVFKLPPIWVYFVLYLDEFEKMAVVIHHYRKKKWLRDITR